MNEILMNVLSAVVTAVILPLISIGGARLITLINEKIKNDEAVKTLTTATDIVTSAVRSVFQTYVESLKNAGSFDKDAQEIALSKAKEVAMAQMSEKVKSYITTNYGSLEEWLTVQIEATINMLKNA